MRNLLILLGLLLCFSLAAIEPTFSSGATISPDGNTICFAYMGDLWSVPFAGGDAVRLTATESDEYNPSYSPDGKWIAFNSDRDGINAVYTIPAVGGNAVLVCADNYSLSDWYPDGQHLLLMGYRESVGEWGLYCLTLNNDPTKNERPVLVAGIGGSGARVSPDGKHFLFSRWGDTNRPRYQGSDNGDVWETDGTNYTQLTNTPLSEKSPVYSFSGKYRYALRSDGKLFQLIRSEKPDYSDATVLSHFDVNFPYHLSIARQNDRIVFHVFDQIWSYEPTTGNLAQVKINIREDLMPQTTVREHITNRFDDYAVSPNGKFVVFKYKFDLFAVPDQGGDVKQITFDHTGIEQFTVMADNQTIYFAKRVDGVPTLFKTTIDHLDQVTPVQAFDKAYIEDLYTAPGKRLMVHYSVSENRNYVACIDSLNQRHNLVDRIVADRLRVSPDGKYAFVVSTQPTNWNLTISLLNLADTTSTVLMKREAWIDGPVWGKDGTSAFYMQDGNIYRWDLASKTDFWDKKDYWKPILAPDPKDKTKKGHKDRPTKPQVKPCRFEFDGIADRATSIIDRDGQNTILTVIDDSTFYYINNNNGNNTIRKANYSGKNDVLVAMLPDYRGNLTYIDNTRQLYFLSNRQLQKINLANKRPSQVGNDFRYEYDKLALNGEIFKQVWVEFGRGFYDPKMNNTDWNALRTRYLQYLPDLYSMNALQTMVDTMIGEVNASHTGFYPRRDGDQPWRDTALLGVEFDEHAILPQGIKITKVYRNSALDKPFGVKPGDVLLSIDNQNITPQTAIQSLLADKTGNRIQLAIAHGDSVLHAEIKGLHWGDQSQLRYQNWVWERKCKVDSLSHGKIGYLHIQGMDEPSYQRFLQDLRTENFDKDALIIDVRGNGGGYTHDELIEALTRKAYAFSSTRTYQAARQKTPGDAFEKPMVVLINQDSFSDAEIFPTLFQELKLGKVIGVPTSGSVIGTGHMWFMDGSSMRMPSDGWFTLSGKNMEGNGCQPDILVVPTPEQQIGDNDVQLKASVDELLKEIKEQPKK